MGSAGVSVGSLSVLYSMFGVYGLIVLADFNTGSAFSILVVNYRLVE